MARAGAVIGLVALLASVDLAMAVMAKEWTLRREHWILAGGALASIVLFGVFAIAARYAEASVVTLGWVVALQVGLMLVERVRYGVHQGTDRWVAVAAMMAIQGYLLFTAGSSA